MVIILLKYKINKQISPYHVTYTFIFTFFLFCSFYINITSLTQSCHGIKAKTHLGQENSFLQNVLASKTLVLA